MHFFDKNKSLSLDDTVAVRGIAILAIIFYNFIRHIIGIDGNEDCWNDENVVKLLSGLKTYMAPLFAVSYWGWYGVTLFIFLSGYGLTKKYSNSDMNIPKYLFGHIKKIYILMVPAFVLYLFVHIVVCGANYPLSLIIKQCTFTVNFLSHTISPGIYWFFGLIIQFYGIFILLKKVKIKWLFVLLLIFIIFDYYIIYICWDPIYFKHNCVAWMLPFLLGMIYAKNKYNLLDSKLALVTIPLFFVTSLIKGLYPFSHVFCILSVLSIVRFMNFKWLYHVGSISSAIFAIHAIVRTWLYHDFTSLNLFFRLFLFTVITFTVSYIYYRFINYLNRKL